MAITVDQFLGTGKAGASTTTTLVTAQTVAAGAMIVLQAGRFNASGTTMSCAGGGLTWVEDKTAQAGSIRSSTFRAFAPVGLASGTTLTVTHTGASDCMLCAESFLGVDTVGTIVNTGTNTGTGTGWDGGSVAVNGNLLVGGGFCDGLIGSSLPTAPGVEFADFNDTPQNETATGVYNLAAAGTTTIAGTWSGSVTWIATSVAYKALASGGFVVARPIVMLLQGTPVQRRVGVQIQPSIVSTTAQVFNQALTATVTTLSTIQNQVNKFLTATSTTTASIQKQINKFLTATGLNSATIQKQANKPLTGNVTSTASMIRKTLKNLTATVTTTASLSALKVILLTMIANVTSTATIQKQVNKLVSATATTAASMVRLVLKNLSATVTSTASLSTLKVILVNMTANVTSTATIKRLMQTNMVATVTSSATIKKLITKTISATSVVSGVLNKRIPLAMIATVTSTATLSAIYHAFAASTPGRAVKWFLSRAGFYG